MTAAGHHLHSGLSLAESRRPLGGAVLSFVPYMQRQQYRFYAVFSDGSNAEKKLHMLIYSLLCDL